jgi:hypothetical protein
MFGCSHCHQLAVSSGAHWCKGEWRAAFDTVIRYQPDHASKIER